MAKHLLEENSLPFFSLVVSDVSVAFLFTQVHCTCCVHCIVIRTLKKKVFRNSRSVFNRFHVRNLHPNKKEQNNVLWSSIIVIDHHYHRHHCRHHHYLHFIVITIFIIIIVIIIIVVIITSSPSSSS